MSEFITTDALSALQVIMIDLVLAGDNAIVIGWPLPTYPRSSAPERS
jgi:predicted tellurium resistance membrane protein TerC